MDDESSAPSSVSLFVPGRLCLFGEHSDWAGENRRFNADINAGYCLVAGTEQGLFAKASTAAHDAGAADDEGENGWLALRSVSDSGEEQTARLRMEPAALRVAAEEGGFYSYAAGTALVVLTRFHVRGISIDNFKTTLPMSKGLSSSAALCVLVARAFNVLFGLGLTARGEMDVAYAGEVLTPSKCGKMDQCCAFGHQPVLMTFNGDVLLTEPLDLPAGKRLHFVIVDLAGAKDTTEILQGLQDGYPYFAYATEIQSSVRRLLGAENETRVRAAVAAVRAADGAALGSLMQASQAAWDENIAACPAQLAAPKLHALLAHEALQPLLFGGKGVGSQGDGTAQLLCVSREAQVEAAALVERDFAGMQCFELTLRHSADNARVLQTAQEPASTEESVAAQMPRTSSAAFTLAEQVLDDLDELPPTAIGGQISRAGVKDILLSHGVEGVGAEEAGEGQLVVETVALLLQRSAPRAGGGSSCCG